MAAVSVGDFSISNIRGNTMSVRKYRSSMRKAKPLPEKWVSNCSNKSILI